MLIDEYDTPLQQAYLNGFFPEAVAFLYKAVMTRISKEACFPISITSACTTLAKIFIWTTFWRKKTDDLQSLVRFEFSQAPQRCLQRSGYFDRSQMGLKASAGLKQVEEKAYYQELQTAGCSKIQAYSIAFDGKRVSSQYRFWAEL
ncbi:MAG: hypothetical protein I8H75_00245 [Myxococcaceae bacterium]|nr:hypothetical protein [Myxococcaceae bacterium]